MSNDSYFELLNRVLDTDNKQNDLIKTINKVQKQFVFTDNNGKKFEYSLYELEKLHNLTLAYSELTEKYNKLYEEKNNLIDDLNKQISENDKLREMMKESKDTNKLLELLEKVHYLEIDLEMEKRTTIKEKMTKYIKNKYPKWKKKINLNT